MLNTLLAYVGYISIFMLIFGMGGLGYLLDTSPRLKNTIKFFTFSFFTTLGVVAGFVIIANMPDTLVPSTIDWPEHHRQVLYHFVKQGWLLIPTLYGWYLLLNVLRLLGRQWSKNGVIKRANYGLSRFAVLLWWLLSGFSALFILSFVAALHFHFWPVLMLPTACVLALYYASWQYYQGSKCWSLVGVLIGYMVLGAGLFLLVVTGQSLLLGDTPINVSYIFWFTVFIVVACLMGGWFLGRNLPIVALYCASLGNKQWPLAKENLVRYQAITGEKFLPQHIRLLFSCFYNDTKQGHNEIIQTHNTEVLRLSLLDIPLAYTEEESQLVMALLTAMLATPSKAWFETDEFKRVAAIVERKIV